MKFTIIAIGKLNISFIKDGVNEFLKRLRPYAQVNVIELKEEKISNKPSAKDREKVVKAEGEKILKLIKPQQHVVLLDVYGKTMSSEKLADWIEELKVGGVSEIVFVIGGTYGVSEGLRARAKTKLSISPMTFTHQMARLLLVEQLYRACKIAKKEPYHW